MLGIHNYSGYIGIDNISCYNIGKSNNPSDDILLLNILINLHKVVMTLINLLTLVTYLVTKLIYLFFIRFIQNIKHLGKTKLIYLKQRAHL